MENKFDASILVKIAVLSSLIVVSVAAAFSPEFEGFQYDPNWVRWQILDDEKKVIRWYPSGADVIEISADCKMSHVQTPDFYFSPHSLWYSEEREIIGISRGSGVLKFEDGEAVFWDIDAWFYLGSAGTSSPFARSRYFVFGDGKVYKFDELTGATENKFGRSESFLSRKVDGDQLLNLKRTVRGYRLLLLDESGVELKRISLRQADECGIVDVSGSKVQLLFVIGREDLIEIIDIDDVDIGNSTPRVLLSKPIRDSGRFDIETGFYFERIAGWLQLWNPVGEICFEYEADMAAFRNGKLIAINYQGRNGQIVKLDLGTGKLETYTVTDDFCRLTSVAYLQL